MKQYEIAAKRRLNENMVWITIYAPLVARHARPGQFVILRTDEFGERVPLTMAGSDAAAGTVDIIFAAVGRSTEMMFHMEPGDCFADVVGPLGKPTHMEGLKKVCVVGGGTGNALAYPLATGMQRSGISVEMICGYKSRDFVILEEEFRRGVDRLHVVTDDGSYGEKAFTTEKLRQLLDAGNQYDEIVTVGPPIMMKLVSAIAAEYGVPVIASLCAYMVDGTGMCGGCRCRVDGKDQFVCVDGPEFDGAKVDWDNLIRRNSYYAAQEAEARAHVCRLTGGVRSHG